MADGEGGGLGRLIKFILALVLLGLLAAGGFAAYLFLSTGEEMAGTEQSPATLRQDGGSIQNPYYLQLGDFVVNLADGRRYLKTNLQLLISEESARTYLEVRLAEVKDLVVAELQTLNSEQLRDGRDRELLKNRLLSKIESLLPTKDREWDDPKPIKKVLITEFYLQ